MNKIMIIIYIVNENMGIKQVMKITVLCIHTPIKVCNMTMDTTSVSKLDHVSMINLSLISLLEIIVRASLKKSKQMIIMKSKFRPKNSSILLSTCAKLQALTTANTLTKAKRWRAIGFIKHGLVKFKPSMLYTARKYLIVMEFGEMMVVFFGMTCLLLENICSWKNMIMIKKLLKKRLIST